VIRVDWRGDDGRVRATYRIAGPNPWAELDAMRDEIENAGHEIIGTYVQHGIGERATLICAEAVQ
jgi:hypothetical protein